MIEYHDGSYALDIDDLFRYGMKRELIPAKIPAGPSLELGPGNNPVGADHELEFPGWNGEHDDLPFEDGGMAAVFAFHFLEHLSPDRVVYMLREIERVLEPGGVLTLLVPYYSSEIAFRDLDHKSFFTESTWDTLFENEYYDKNKEDWRLVCEFNIIMGQAGRKMALISQIVKR